MFGRPGRLVGAGVDEHLLFNVGTDDREKITSHDGGDLHE